MRRVLKGTCISNKQQNRLPLKVETPENQREVLETKHAVDKIKISPEGLSIRLGMNEDHILEDKTEEIPQFLEQRTETENMKEKVTQVDGSKRWTLRSLRQQR